MYDIYFVLLALALIIEAVVTTIKWAFDPKKYVNPWRVLAILLGVGVALAYKVDILALAGVTPAWGGLWWVGSVLTGLVMARGANVVTDLAKYFELLKEGKPLPEGQGGKGDAAGSVM